jgi:hypothetical protein
VSAIVAAPTAMKNAKAKANNFTEEKFRLCGGVEFVRENG